MFSVLTLEVVPGTGDWVVTTEPVCPVRPDNGNCAAVEPPPGEGDGPPNWANARLAENAMPLTTQKFVVIPIPIAFGIGGR